MSAITNPLLTASQMFPQTQLWNDSCGIEDLNFALARGASGATSNPVIVGNVLRQEISHWNSRLREVIDREHAGATDEEICWIVSHEAGLVGAGMMLPLFEQTAGKKGWQALQVNPRYYRSAQKTVEHAKALSSGMPNLLIKMPVSTAGITAIEECVYEGVSVNGTVCFGLPQAIAVAEAVERGLRRRREQGLSCDGLFNSCTIMNGRIDDYMKSLVQKRNLDIPPSYLDMGGIAVFKKAYGLFQKRGYNLKLLAANNHSHFLWSELLGGDILMTINPVWWRELEGKRMELRNTIDEPVNPAAIEMLRELIPEYRSIYDESGMNTSDFNDYGAFKATMREFLTGYDGFIEYLRDFMLMG